MSAVLQRRTKPRAAVVVQFLASSRPHGLDPRLVPTDRLLERWAVSQGSDEYLFGWDTIPPKSRPPPLPDDLAIIVDQIILRPPVQRRTFLTRWYMSPGESVTALAKSLGIHRDSVQMRWTSSLWSIRRDFLFVNLDV